MPPLRPWPSPGAGRRASRRWRWSPAVAAGLVCVACVLPVEGPGAVAEGRSSGPVTFPAAAVPGPAHPARSVSRPVPESGLAHADHPADPVRDAVTVPLAGGEVTVEPARAVVARLRSRGLVVAVADGARASGSGGLSLALDERSHLLAADGALLGGQLVTAEGIELVAGDGRSRAAVTGLAVDLADGTVTALTGGGGTVVLGAFGRDGSLVVTPEGAVSLGGTVALSTAGAGAVNSAVGHELFSAGEELGRLAVRAEVVLDENVSRALRVPPEAPPAASGPGSLP